jgi:cell wall-associated NlpC family hydrolase
MDDAALAGVAAQRRAVVAEALSWLGTPFHHEAGIKKVGVDCAYFLKAVFVKAGLIEDFAIPHYPPDWHMHRDYERYLSFVTERARPITESEAQPGDVVVFKVGRCFSHGAVVVAWPRIVHAWVVAGVQEEDAATATWLNFVGERTDEEGKPRQRKFFSYWGR